MADLRRSRELAIQSLLAERNVHGWWDGFLSSSALSTATAVVALATVRRHALTRDARLLPLIRSGLDWLAGHQNGDGGWGDTVHSLSNISTTTLCWSAFGVVEDGDLQHPETVARARSWLTTTVGRSDSPALIDALKARYGKDRTFSIPILAHCVLCGRLGDGAKAWEAVVALPFELAALPRQWFATLQLPVVSYALPALIAIGQARHYHAPTRNPFLRALRNRVRHRTLGILEQIQPSNGGFLEATPLTSFVTMSLASMQLTDHPVVRKGIEFLVSSARQDGSWPIDTNLSTWVTTLSVSALLSARKTTSLNPDQLRTLMDWLMGQQYGTVHAYTLAKPGGWSWTDLPGAVPDADDTAGALVALQLLDGARVGDSSRTRLATDRKVFEDSGRRGVRWLLGLQNRDGGIPTFCRGWGALPFDRSSPDITAHAMRAWLMWLSSQDPRTAEETRRALERAAAYLVRTQETEGSWVPLWFGCQHARNEVNRTYGTSRVVLALERLLRQWPSMAPVRRACNQGTGYLISSQHSTGGWSGERGNGPCTIEETALALEALGHARDHEAIENKDSLEAAIAGGESWMIQAIDSGGLELPSPIGLYFAKLWYHEKLYPKAFAVAALQSLSKTQ